MEAKHVLFKEVKQGENKISNCVVSVRIRSTFATPNKTLLGRDLDLQRAFQSTVKSVKKIEHNVDKTETVCTFALPNREIEKGKRNKRLQRRFHETKKFQIISR